MKSKIVGMVALTGLMPLGAVTLEELAARMDKTEKKLEAYEERFWPFERGGRGADSGVDADEEFAASAGGFAEGGDDGVG